MPFPVGAVDAEHETRPMSRQRFIYPQMLTSENFISLSREARLLFVGLIAVADDYGRGKGSPRSLKATVFPADEDVTAADVAGWCDELAGQGMARFYSDGNGQRFYDLPAWSKYQSPRYKAKSQVPSFEEVPRSPAEPPEDLRQKRREEKRSEEKRGGEEQQPSRPQKQAARLAEPPGFADWYKAYPRKVGRPTAAKAYRKALQQGATADVLLAAVEAQKRWPPGHGLNKSMTDGGDPHPSTWLNQGRWEDEKPVIKSPYEVM